MTEEQKTDWLRERGWTQNKAGRWRLPASTMFPLAVSDAYTIGQLLEKADSE